MPIYSNGIWGASCKSMCSQDYNHHTENQKTHSYSSVHTCSNLTLSAYNTHEGLDEALLPPC